MRIYDNRLDLFIGGSGGINGAKPTTRGLGEANPVAPNTHPDGSDNPEGRQKNRRVEIAVQK